jgi:hypothetical protein
MARHRANFTEERREQPDRNRLATAGLAVVEAPGELSAN